MGGVGLDADRPGVLVDGEEPEGGYLGSLLKSCRSYNSVVGQHNFGLKKSCMQQFGITLRPLSRQYSGQTNGVYDLAPCLIQKPCYNTASML